jgi:hypothetical protein
MPWPWSIAIACLDLSSGQVLNWPLPTSDFEDNNYILKCAYEVWRVVHLHNKPKTTGKGKSMKTNWTPHDVDYFAYLTENARKGWTLHVTEGDDGAN